MVPVMPVAVLALQALAEALAVALDEVGAGSAASRRASWVAVALMRKPSGTKVRVVVSGRLTG
jgi:hypothetical protein